MTGDWVSSYFSSMAISVAHTLFCTDLEEQHVIAPRSDDQVKSKLRESVESPAFH